MIPESSVELSSVALVSPIIYSSAALVCEEAVVLSVTLIETGKL